MRREIRFRGLRTDGKGWVYGMLVYSFEGTHIIESEYFKPSNGCLYELIDVNPESVGQFTGLKDRNGKDIYEGDIIAISSRGLDFDCQVTYDKQLIPVGEKSKGWEHMLYSPCWEECVIIGNIHQQK